MDFEQLNDDFEAGPLVEDEREDGAVAEQNAAAPKEGEDDKKKKRTVKRYMHHVE